MNEQAIQDRYTPRQYFNKLIKQGHSADYASSLVNAVFGGDE